MPQETEEEDDSDEKISIDGLDDVEKFLDEDDVSDFILEEDEVRKVLASAWKQKRQEISKERLRRGFGKPSKPMTAPVTRKGENVHKSRHKYTKKTPTLEEK